APPPNSSCTSTIESIAIRVSGSARALRESRFRRIPETKARARLFPGRDLKRPGFAFFSSVQDWMNILFGEDSNARSTRSAVNSDRPASYFATTGPGTQTARSCHAVHGRFGHWLNHGKGGCR